MGSVERLIMNVYMLKQGQWAVVFYGGSSCSYPLQVRHRPGTGFTGLSTAICLPVSSQPSLINYPLRRKPNTAVKRTSDLAGW
jgi:hypothetical protein